MEKIIDRLIGSADDKICEIEEKLIEGDNDEYTKALKAYREVYDKMKEYHNITKTLLDFESRVNWLNYLENRHMYTNGFEDGFKCAFDLMKMLNQS
ncbi:MAG: hypothetical protein N4A63_13375 [Vallitalea sp.]|jgi:hypothetical protein|nr:hypothetical protein [Vallitalea sp.]